MSIPDRRNDRTPPTDARQLRSRKALTGALLSLLEEKSFDQLTIREISARAGTGYATFFRHYPTKEALLSDIASDEISALLRLTTPILHGGQRYGSVVALCNYVAEHRNLWSALLTGGAAGILREEFIHQGRKLAENEPPAPNWLPSDLAIVHGTGGTIDLLAWWLTQEEFHEPEEMAGLLDRLILAPLFGDRGSEASDEE